MFLRRRFAATSIDAVVVIVLGMLLASTAGDWAAARTAIVLRVGQPETFWRGPLPMVLGAIGNLVYGLPLNLLLVLLPEAFAGRSLGKLVARLQVTPVAPDGTNTALRRRLLTKCAPCLLALASMITLQLWLACMAVAVAILLGAGAIPLLWGRVPLHDRLARTRLQVHM